MNVDLLQNINTHLFNIKFNSTENGYCYFKKNNNKFNILLLCDVLGSKDQIYLGKIE